MTVKDQYDEIEARLAELAARDQAAGPIEVFSELPALAGTVATVGPAPAAPLGQLVENTLSDLVGATWGNWDAVEAGLAANVEFEEIQGTRRAVVKPKGFTVRADLGAITGAQQVIAEQFLAMRDRIVPELTALTPLAVAVDPQQRAASVQIVLNAVQTLAGAYTILDGVNVQLADETWRALIGADPAAREAPSANPEQPFESSNLWQLKRVFGFYRQLVNTTDQELDLSRFIGIVSSLNGEYAAYTFHRNYFAGDDSPEYAIEFPPYLGPQFRKLAVLFAVLAQCAREFGGALSALYIDPTEWESLVLRTPQGPLNFGTYMQWLADFPEKGQETLRRSGKEGARSLVPEAQRLADATRAADPAGVKLFPALYGRSPIVASTQGAVEQTLLKIVKALLPYTEPGSGQILTVGLPDNGAGGGGGGGGATGPGSEPPLGSTGIEGWTETHFKGSQVGICVQGNLDPDQTYGLSLQKSDNTGQNVGHEMSRSADEICFLFDISEEDPGRRLVYLVDEQDVTYPVGSIEIAELDGETTPAETVSDPPPEPTVDTPVEAAPPAAKATHGKPSAKRSGDK